MEVGWRRALVEPARTQVKPAPLARAVEASPVLYGVWSNLVCAVQAIELKLTSIGAGGGARKYIG